MLNKSLFVIVLRYIKSYFFSVWVFFYGNASSRRMGTIHQLNYYLRLMSIEIFVYSHASEIANRLYSPYWWNTPRVKNYPLHASTTTNRAS